MRGSCSASRYWGRDYRQGEDEDKNKPHQNTQPPGRDEAGEENGVLDVDHRSEQKEAQGRCEWKRGEL